MRIVFPFVKITSMARQSMNEARKAMEDMQRQSQQYQQTQKKQETGKVDGEYIDFEEVK